MRFFVLMVIFLSLAGCASNTELKGKPLPKESVELKELKPQASVTPYTGENLYTKSYFSLDKPNVALQPDPAGPKLFRGVNKDTDNNRMLVKGFDMLGYSNFESGDIPPELALEQAKTLHADLVLLYTSETTKTPASVKIQQLKEQAMKAKAGDDSAAAGDGANYAYYASYWVKLAPPAIGVHVRGVSKNTQSDGLEVLAAVEGTPAYKAGLQEGDVLKRIGTIELHTTEALGQVVKQYAGKTVEVSYTREGELKTTSMTLNPR